MPRVGQKPERSAPKPFSTEWILAPPEEAPVRYAPELPTWIPSERKMMALFIIVLTIIIAIGGSSGEGGQAPVENRPVVQTPIQQTATTGPAVTQPITQPNTQPNSVRGTEPLPPPRPTATGGPTEVAAAPAQAP